MNASDDDVSSLYSKLTYVIVDGDVPFEMTADGDVVLSRGVDAEEVSSYRFTVEARDGGGR